MAESNLTRQEDFHQLSSVSPVGGDSEFMAAASMAFPDGQLQTIQYAEASPQDNQVSNLNQRDQTPEISSPMLA